MNRGSITLDRPFGIGTDDYKDGFLGSQAKKLDFSGIEGTGRLRDLFDRGEFDLVAVGRAMIANPDRANLVRDNNLHELKTYSRDLLATLD